MLSILVLFHELVELSLNDDLRGAMAHEISREIILCIVLQAIKVLETVPYKCCKEDSIGGQPSPQLSDIIRVPSKPVPTTLGLRP